MDADRLRTGELIAAVAGVALLIIMFLPWFGIDFGPAGGVAEDFAEDLGVETSASFSAWESFDFIDLVLLVTVIVAVGLAIATAMAQTVALPVTAGVVTAGLGILSTLLILYRVIDPVGDASRKYGLFLGLIAAAAIAYGGWRSMDEESTGGGRAADRAGGGAAPPPPPPAGTAS